MKIITFVKPDINSKFIRVLHEIREGHSASEDFVYWTEICARAKSEGIICDYEVDIAKA